MCGIVGYIGNRDAVPTIIDALRRQEYRGYDSAGVAIWTGKSIEVLRKKGKIRELEELLNRKEFHGNIGVGHTRWATHGRPSDENAHPHRAGGLVVVHNGIIENYLSLRERLIKRNHTFKSQTDSEVIAHLIEDYIKRANGFVDAFRSAVNELKGSFALAVLYEKEPDFLLAARLMSPLIIGIGDSEAFITSDIPAVLPYTRDVLIMNDMEIARVSRDSVRVMDFAGRDVRREPKRITWTASMAEKGGYSHFMEKEIFEQPNVIADTLRGRYSLLDGEVTFEDPENLKKLLKRINRVCIIACGTSYHAALTGRYIIEGLARLPVDVDFASEFRYRNPFIDHDTLVLAISQSGETADTLAGVKEARSKGAPVVAICNVLDSSIPRESTTTLYTRAGPEIAVASTKTFVAQLIVLILFGLALAQQRGVIDKRRSIEILEELIKLPQHVESILRRNNVLRGLARKFYLSKNFLYLGRGINFPVAMEGALKLKEISYIHAEAYSAGEMKHGPIALIDEEMPSLFVCPNGSSYGKVLSNMEEIRARNGRIISIATEGNDAICSLSDEVFYIPGVPEILSPVVLVIPLQLFAYHVAVLKGTDVDQPRNLAKSVTVE